MQEYKMFFIGRVLIDIKLLQLYSCIGNTMIKYCSIQYFINNYETLEHYYKFLNEYLCIQRKF